MTQHVQRFPWAALWPYLIAMALTASAFEGFHAYQAYRAQFVRAGGSWCDVWGGTWLGWGCREDIHHILPD